MKRTFCKTCSLFALFILITNPILATNQGRMTGGGSVGLLEDNPGFRITHGFELHCDAAKLPNNLEVNWSGNRFHLESLTTNSCVLQPPDPRPPAAPIWRMDGTGAGRYNGQSGCSISFSLTDRGEPGTSDEAFFVITCPVLGVVLSGGGVLTFGNHQALRETP